MSSQPTSRGTEQRSDLSKDVIFDILSNHRRRYVLIYLNQNRGHGTLSEAAEWIAGRENDVDAGVPSSKQRKRVYVSLYQSHLPRMDDVGIIEFESDRGEIELCRPATDLFQYLETTDDCVRKEPAFEYSEDLHRRIYVRPESWQEFEDACHFEAEKRLSQRGVRSVTSREIHDAMVQLAADRPAELARYVLAAREMELQDDP